jgi:hypothetical protein
MSPVWCASESYGCIACPFALLTPARRKPGLFYNFIAGALCIQLALSRKLSAAMEKEKADVHTD